VDRALGRLLHRYETGEGSADAAYWLAAGVLAQGRLDDARVLLAETRAGHPDDLRFEVLEAILAYRGDDLNRARTILESVVKRDPKNAVAWTDLGVARAGLGLPDRAREAWERARVAAPGSPAARRAEAHLASP
jgi:Flp pilus assembly protein TadD